MYCKCKYTRKSIYFFSGRYDSIATGIMFGANVYRCSFVIIQNETTNYTFQKGRKLSMLAKLQYYVRSKNILDIFLFNVKVMTVKVRYTRACYYIMKQDINF